MNKREFAKLVSGVREMAVHLRREEVKDTRVTEIPYTDVSETRLMADVFQLAFAADWIEPA